MIDKKELKRAIKNAAEWEENLTVRQKNDMPYTQAKAEALGEILTELVGIIQNQEIRYIQTWANPINEQG
jgi:hypothetical protein